MIHLLATGGTIAGEADPDARPGRYRAGVRPVEALLAAVPGLDALGPLTARQILALDSKDMTPADWLTLLAATRAALDEPACAGVVILHGTDTLEETAWFLHLTLPAGKPVVLTGAMRPADHPAADGPANLRAALRLAASPEACDKGVLVVMNGQIFGARGVVKARSTGLDAFESPEPWQSARPDGRFAGLQVAELPRVDILPGYAGAPADLIDASVAAGARGLVLALAGNGSVPAAWLPALRAARRQGVAIVRGSRAAGPVEADANADDTGEGWLTAGDQPPPKARIALMLGLASGLGGEALRAVLLACDAARSIRPAPA
ncbi:asparaginase [Zoogloea sp.]|jgi:L-asparaginase|uniref:asparaginase n=1 Tax=Zoogloea sp. TaxID=49181 RepID=UPI0035AD9232